MKAFIDPIPSTLSKAMHRVSDALKLYAPADVEIVASPAEADVHLVHVIGDDAITYESPAKSIAVFQYCLRSTTKAELTPWLPLWERARLVWSYYDTPGLVLDSKKFYHSPLGVGQPFTLDVDLGAPRPVGILTSGYVAGPGAEAIEEPALAAAQAGLPTTHLGPKPYNFYRDTPIGWHSIQGCDDSQLALAYRRSMWVSGLRYVEGFELPVIEGAACGARPIVFDRPDMHQWYEDLAVFVPELSGDKLVEVLRAVMSDPWRMSEEERLRVIHRFDWSRIASEFWRRLQENV